MWEALKKAGIDAERQYEIREPGVSYDLDFAIECRDGTKINVECNGDAYHSTKAARDRDRRRGAYLETKGWRVLRFGTDDIRQDVHGCVHQIRELMNRHGGPAERSLTYDLYQSETDLQLDLFKR
jgi:very-short-patch-repair endonuclease